jgi:hypothetical protein
MNKQKSVPVNGVRVKEINVFYWKITCSDKKKGYLQVFKNLILGGYVLLTD